MANIEFGSDISGPLKPFVSEKIGKPRSGLNYEKTRFQIIRPGKSVYCSSDPEFAFFKSKVRIRTIEI